MNERTQLNKQKLGLVGTIFGSLIIGLPAIPLAALAVPTVPNPALNPCPKIYYEDPYNTKLIVPQACPPNAATKLWIEQGRAPNPQTLNITPSKTGVTPIQPPLPESRQNAIATVTPAGKVNVRLKNDTNARISYQAIGYTEQRYLTGGEEVVLRGLSTPVTIAMVREDGGLVKVMPTATSESGMLAVSLNETTTLDNNQGVLRIQRDGQVFLN